MSKANTSHVLSDRAVNAILGIGTSVPVDSDSMAQSLRVTFFPIRQASDRVRGFSTRLSRALASYGVTILDYADALADPASGKLREGIVVIAPGELETGNLPVDHVTNLRRATVVGVIDGPCPAHAETQSQEKLNSIVRTLSWNIVQVVIYVDDDAWTVCTMNGAIIRSTYASFDQAVYHVLVPKIAAPVVPPHASDFDVREGGLDLHDGQLRTYVKDFEESGKLWADTGLMLFHTSLDTLEFRNRYYQRLAAAYLDHRSGMSYGFLARQLAGPAPAVLSAEEAAQRFGRATVGDDVLSPPGELWVLLNLPGGMRYASIPDIWMLTTRSGCDKSNIDPHRDLVLLGLSRGRVIFVTPGGVSTGIDCKPSYDTLTILSHGIANALIAGVQSVFAPHARFFSGYSSSGTALAHWHGYLHESVLPEGYVVHGERNPPVSCSTFQAAIYALQGKVDIFAETLRGGHDFAGDVHVEPHHGVNLTGPTLLWLAQWALDHIDTLAEIQANGVLPKGRDVIGR